MVDTQVKEVQASNSPLGEDAPVTETIKTPVEQVDTNKPATRNINESEFEELSRKASGYDTLTNDPELAPQIMDHYRAKTGKVNPAPEKREESSKVESNPDVTNVLKANQALTTRLAQLEVREFRRDHPDMKDVEPDMARLVAQHGMSLDDAYKYARAAKAQSSDTNIKKQADVPQPTSEGSMGAFDNNSGNDLEALQKQIDDPKATPHMDDVIEKAWKAAKKLNNK